MSKILQIKIFNDILDQFMDYLDENFKFFRSDLILIRNTMEFIRRSNPRLVVEQYMSYVGPYKKHIFNCDENFFINFDKNGHFTLSQYLYEPSITEFRISIASDEFHSSFNGTLFGNSLVSQLAQHIWFCFSIISNASNGTLHI